MSAEAWTAAGVIATALCGLLAAVLVEVIRSRRRGDRAAQQATLAAVELSPNGGKSTRDAIDRIEQTVASIDSRIRDHGERLAFLEGMAQGSNSHTGGNT